MKLFLQMLVVVALTILVTFGVLTWRRGAAPQPAPPVEVAGLSDVGFDLQAALALAESRGCPACHTLDGSEGLGPTWRGAWGSIREFMDGSVAEFDAAYLRQSLSDPSARVVPGFQNVMLPVQLSEEELLLLEQLFRELGRAEVY